MTSLTTCVWLASAAIATEPPIFERPFNVRELNTTCRDKGPFLSCDGLTVYFHSDRAICNAVPDIWRSHRATLGSPFAPPERVLVNGADPAVSCDDLTMYLVRAAQGPLGQHLDIFRSTRESITAPWPEPVPVPELNTPYDELGPKLSHDGLSIFFVSDRPGTLGNLDIWVASRDTKQEPFKPAVNVTELNSPFTETNAALTHDGLAIYFASARPGGVGNADLYRATRTVPFGPFDPPKNLTELNTPLIDKAPTVSGDGLTLLFRSERVGGQGQSDLYEARDARSGAVGVGRGILADVLFVNGSHGGPERTVFAPANAPITIQLGLMPFGPRAINYALIGYFSHLPHAAFELPSNVGAVAFPAPFAVGGQQDGNSVTLCNNLRGSLAGPIGSGIFPAPPGPGEIARLPFGLPIGVEVTFQAIVRDDGSRSNTRVSTSNAVTVKTY
ncbi:MAG: PD40 domain-containing protein [Planctomycetes bacterium]|nr:PD40 domain-containing protein [Planctomycetota bacterium]MBI3845216.1 PD40 domain-containing protein [Planctomycetota bacterium]